MTTLSPPGQAVGVAAGVGVGVGVGVAATADGVKAVAAELFVVPVTAGEFAVNETPGLLLPFVLTVPGETEPLLAFEPEVIIRKDGWPVTIRSGAALTVNEQARENFCGGCDESETSTMNRKASR